MKIRKTSSAASKLVLKKLTVRAVVVRTRVQTGATRACTVIIPSVGSASAATTG